MTLPVFLRPTTASIMQAMTSGLESDQQVISQLQTQIATGKQINKPSDNPAGAVNALALQSANSQVQRYVTNAGDAMSYLGTANGTLNDALQQLQSLRSTVLSAVSGVNDQAGLRAAAQQVESVRQGLLRDANMTYLGQPVFGGSTTNALAFDTTTGAYLGSGSPASRVVGPTTKVAVSVTRAWGAGHPARTPVGCSRTTPTTGPSRLRRPRSGSSPS
jgi:flagellar hook-associated protein 3 FlgL